MANFGFHTTGDEIVSMFADQVRRKTFLLTGPSEGGIGAEMLMSLARAEPKGLILAGRSKSKVQPVVDHIEKISPESVITYVQLDLGSQESVRGAVEAIKALGTPVDVLVNNAALMACPFLKTTDGIEMQFSTNHVGPFLFTNLLLKEGLIPDGGRIVNVNSSASIRRGFIILPNFDDLTYDDGKKYNPWTAYAVSKSAGMLYTRTLAAMLSKRNITALSLNPGSISSQLQRHVTQDMVADAVRLAKASNPDWKFPDRKTLQEGCSTQMRAALDPSLTPLTGAFLEDCQPKVYQEHVEAYGAAQKVWKLSERLVGEEFNF